MPKIDKDAEQQLRLECLKLADGDVHRAKKNFEYVVGATEQQKLLRLWHAFKAAIAYSSFEKPSSLIYSIEDDVGTAFMAEGLDLPCQLMAFHDYCEAELKAEATSAVEISCSLSVGGAAMIGMVPDASLPALSEDEPAVLGEAAADRYAGA